MIVRRTFEVGILLFFVGFAATCSVLAYNMMKLADAQSFVIDHVRQALTEGSAMPTPVAPSARQRLADRVTRAMLDHARAIGPLVALEDTRCAAQSAADVAMCRAGDLHSYQLAGSLWHFDDGWSPVDDEREDPPI